MAVLVLDEAKYPDGCSATPASGGSLAASTKYYYRVAAVTNTGETCASESFNGTTTDVNKTLNLAWNAVAGVKASGGYRIYRNASDLWASGSLLLATVSTNSYTDDGSVSLGAGYPMTLATDKVKMAPETEASLVAEKNIPGKEGGSLDYLGSPPKRLHIEGYFRGASAKTDLDKLRAIRAGGVAIQVTYTAYSQTWIQAEYLVSSLSWWLEPSVPNDADAIMLRVAIELLSA